MLITQRLGLRGFFLTIQKSSNGYKMLPQLQYISAKSHGNLSVYICRYEIISSRLSILMRWNWFLAWLTATGWTEVKEHTALLYIYFNLLNIQEMVAFLT
jgi:hypothetical protein